MDSYTAMLLVPAALTLYPYGNTGSTSHCRHSVSNPGTLFNVNMTASTEDCWIVLGNRVIDVTEFLDYHPGGRKCLVKRAGEAADTVVDFEFHSPIGRKMWFKYQIGMLDGVEDTGPATCSIM